jgi:hypothetical protein
VGGSHSRPPGRSPPAPLPWCGGSQTVAWLHLLSQHDTKADHGAHDAQAVFVRALVHPPTSSRDRASGRWRRGPSLPRYPLKKKAACGRPLTSLPQLFTVISISNRKGVPHTGVHGASLRGRSARAATALAALLLCFGGSPASEADLPAPLMGCRVRPAAGPPRVLPGAAQRLFSGPLSPWADGPVSCNKGYDATTPSTLAQTGSTRVSSWASS